VVGGAVFALLVTVLTRKFIQKHQELVPAPAAQIPTMKSEEETVIRESKAIKSTAVVIFLHGLGDTCHGWAQGFQRIHLDMPYIKFIHPTAPVRAVTLNHGMTMTAWYDIKSFGRTDNEDFAGLEESKEFLTKLIQKEIEGGIDPSRIVIGGFSQGAALSLYTGYQFPGVLGGILAMSGYLPVKSLEEFSGKPDERAKATPFLMCHGDADQIVKYEWAQKSYEALKALSITGELKTYKGMQHSSSATEMTDVRQFIRKVLPPL